VFLRCGGCCEATVRRRPDCVLMLCVSTSATRL